MGPTLGHSVSPGLVKLAGLMDPGNYATITTTLSPQERKEEFNKYQSFPMYPTGEFVRCTRYHRFDELISRFM